jgi:hypothetical protein
MRQILENTPKVSVIRGDKEMSNGSNQAFIFLPAAGAAVEDSAFRTRTSSQSSSSVAWSLLFSVLLLWCGSAAFAQSGDLEPKPAVGPGKVIVHSKFGGQIFGFDIDRNGTEGLLSEATLQNNGTVLAAVETFSQTTGKILKVVSQTQTQDDFITLGVVGTSVGLVEHEHVKGNVVSRTFNTLNPLSANKDTGL